LAIFIDQCKRLEVAADLGAGGRFTLSDLMGWRAGGRQEALGDNRWLIDEIVQTLSQL
jgi:hypothetical protein